MQIVRDFFSVGRLPRAPVFLLCAARNETKNLPTSLAEERQALSSSRRARVRPPGESCKFDVQISTLEGNMPVTERQEHALTQKALDTLTTWGKNPGTDGGENINFSVSRQGAPSDAFMAIGDCTPFTSSGKRGTLHGQPAATPGAPIAYFDNFG